MEKLISALGIDWKILIAQIVNFTILFFVLRAYAFKPLLSVLKKRQEKIESAIKNQTDLEKARESLLEEKALTLKAARLESEKIIEEARILAEKKTETIIEQAKKESAHIINETKKTLTAEREAITREIKAEAKMLLETAIASALPDVLTDSGRSKLVDEALEIMNKTKQS